MTYLLDTSKPESLYETLADIFSTQRHIIEYVIFKNMFTISRLNSADEVDIVSFKKAVLNAVKAPVKINSFDFMTISYNAPIGRDTGE